MMAIETATDGGIMSMLGLKLVNVVAGACSSFVALRFFDGLTMMDKWITFLGGWLLAAWGASPLSEFLQLNPKVEIGIVLLLGLFGMAVAAELVRLARSFNLEWVKTLIGRK